MENNDNKRVITKKNGLPILLAGLVWPVCAILLPFYRLTDFFGAAVFCMLVYFISRSIFKDKVTYEDIPPETTGDVEADKFLSKCRSEMATIATEKAKIGNASVVAKISGIENTVGKIFEYVEKKPDAADKLRRVMNYYLPTLAKLVDTYEDLERQGGTGANVTETMSKIDGMLDTVGEAFKKQLDALYGDVALDISTDISVMDTMMAREGLRSNNN